MRRRAASSLASCPPTGRRPSTSTGARSGHAARGALARLAPRPWPECDGIVQALAAGDGSRATTGARRARVFSAGGVSVARLARVRLAGVNGRVAGAGGSQRLALPPLATTTRGACPEVTVQAARFLGTLGPAVRWRVTGGRLERLDPTGRVRARPEARSGP